MSPWLRFDENFNGKKKKKKLVFNSLYFPNPQSIKVTLIRHSIVSSSIRQTSKPFLNFLSFTISCPSF